MGESLTARRAKRHFTLISYSNVQLWEHPSSFQHCECDAQSQRSHQNKPGPGTHLTHDLDVGDPLRSICGPLVGQNRQHEVSGLGQRLPHQEGVWLISRHEQLLCIGPRQVTVVPPETHGHGLEDVASGTRSINHIYTFRHISSLMQNVRHVDIPDAARAAR